MGNYGAAGRFGTERLLLTQESELLTEEIQNRSHGGLAPMLRRVTLENNEKFMSLSWSH